MLTSAQITDALTAKPTPMAHGALRYLERGEAKYGTGDTTHRRLVSDLLDEPTAPSPPATYEHPAAAAMKSPAKRPGDGSLQPSEIAWLQRIPADPAQVPFADAQQLAALSATLSPLTNRADARLVESVYAPVRDYHDRNAAKADLANAVAIPVSPVPSSALPALARAIGTEHPGLSDDEVMGRANEAVRAAAVHRRTSRDAAIDSAQTRIAALDEAITARMAPVRA